MNILYFHQHFNTPGGSGGVRSYEFARRWVAAGHVVTVITGQGHDATLKKGEQFVDGIRIVCLGVNYRTHYGFCGRVFSFLSFAVLATLIAARAGRYDVVLATSTPLTVALPALAAKRIARCPVVFEVRDVWPDAAISAGVLRNRLLIWMARKLEAAAYRHADHIVPLSTGMQKRICSKGVSRDRTIMLPNCSDLKPFDPRLFDRGALRAAFHAGDRFVILYVGAINLSNDMPFLADAIERTKDDDSMVWWFVGGGNRLKYLRERIERTGAANVVLWGRQPKSEVPRYVNAADVGVVSFINEPVYYENSPNKFFDYCAGGLPVVFTRTTWLQSFLARYHAGLVCENNSLDEFITCLKTLQEDHRKRDNMGRNARRLAEIEFSRDLIAGKYLDLLKKTARGRNHGGDEEDITPRKRP